MTRVYIVLHMLEMRHFHDHTLEMRHYYDHTLEMRHYHDPSLEIIMIIHLKLYMTSPETMTT